LETCLLLFTIGEIPCSFCNDVKDRTDKETTFFRYIDFATSLVLELESVGPDFGERIENANSFFYKKLLLTFHTILLSEILRDTRSLPHNMAGSLSR
jgi:hypothetical protein